MNRNNSQFSKAEMVDIINVLASNSYQLRPSKRQYLEKYPERRQQLQYDVRIKSYKGVATSLDCPVRNANGKDEFS